MESFLWLLLYAGLFYIMMRYGCGAHTSHGGHGSHGSHSNHSSADARHVDPVCGMRVSSDTGYRIVYEGIEYRLCSRKCLDRFESNPTNYVDMQRSA